MPELTRILLALTFVLGLTLGAAASEVEVRVLDASLPWDGDNRERLDELIRSLGASGESYDRDRPPVAVFDWDNTVIKNDIGDGTVFWMLRNDAILQPPGGDWSDTSRFLTPAAIAALSAACAEHPPGEPLPTSTDLDCADEILAIYEDKTTASGEPAWQDEGYDHRRIVPALAWLAQIQAGYTAAQIRDMVGRAIDEYLAAPQGTEIRVGTRDGLCGWIRVYPQIHDLIGTLQANGFDVWVVSASPEPSVQAFAERVGIAADHVIGIRVLTDPEGRLTHRLADCGPEGPDSDRIMTYKEGKRCFIAQEIFGDRTAGAIESASDPARRPALVAGDAQTDIDMLLEAAVLKLVIDRQRSEVLCHALAGTGGEWLLNPMFIEPLSPRTEPYPCATTACSDRAGNPAPCTDPSGGVIPDQPAPASGK